MALHVDVYLGTVGPGQSPERPQPGEHPLGGAGRVDGVELAIEGRELERDVHPRQRTGGAVIDERVMGPGRSSCWQLLEQPRIGRGISVGLGVARDGLTEKVEREGPVPPALEHRRPGSLGRSRARNKPLRLREHRRPHHPRSKCRK